MVTWTQQIQEQLKQRLTGPTSSSSKKELIQSKVIDENE